HLHRRGARGEDSQPAAQRITVAIDEEIDRVLADQPRDRTVGKLAHVAPTIEARAHARSRGTPVVQPIAVTGDFESIAVMVLEQSSHQAPGRVIAKVAGEIADA